MDIDKLDQEIAQILSTNGGTRSYAEIRDELVGRGYSQEELQYILGLVDEQLLNKLDTGGQSKVSKRNMLVGGALCLTGLTVILVAYFGQSLPKEINYIALVVFALGYLVFRNGFRRRNSM
jgi:hypothetical protein